MPPNSCASSKSTKVYLGVVCIRPDMGATVSDCGDCWEEGTVAKNEIEPIVAVKVCSWRVVELLMIGVNQVCVAQEFGKVAVSVLPVAVGIKH